MQGIISGEEVQLITVNLGHIMEWFILKKMVFDVLKGFFEEPVVYRSRISKA